jgi:SAM-dependent methyltransferase
VRTNPYVRAAFPGLKETNLRINPADEMYLFELEAAGGDRANAAGIYYQQGIQCAGVYRQVLEHCFSPTNPAGLILDFASGYGRISRFLPAMVAEDSIWVADILEPAVVFQTKQFGFNGFVSSSVPEELSVAERFDAIFVWSLFTHLPDATFARWLRALHGLLSDRGVLLFSTRGLPNSKDGAEHLFEPVSEIPSLDMNDYGRAYVSESYVRACLSSLGTDPKDCAYFPRGVLGGQDVYLVRRDRAANVADLSLCESVYGMVKHLERETSRVAAYGWAIATDPADTIQGVSLRHDGNRIGTAELNWPPELQVVIGDTRLVGSTWALHAAAPDDSCSLVVTSQRGISQCMWDEEQSLDSSPPQPGDSSAVSRNSDRSVTGDSETQEDIDALTESLRLAVRRVIELGTQLLEAEAHLVQVQTSLAETEAGLETKIAEPTTKLVASNSALATTRSELAATQTELTSTRSEFAASQTELNSTRSELAATKSALTAACAELNAMRATRSWRATAFARRVVFAYRRLLRK